MTSDTKAGENDVAAKTATSRAKKTLEQEIEAAAAKLRKLQELQRENQKRDRERNERAVRDFIKAEKLEDFELDVWRGAATEIRAALERAAGKASSPVVKNSTSAKVAK